MSLTKKIATGLGAGLLAASVIVASPASASEAEAQQASAAVAPANTTHSLYVSHAEVERMYTGMNDLGSLCAVAPIPYPISIACAGFAPSQAIEQAYWQEKRVRVDYTSCGFNYCSSTSFHVVD
ncbi:hypothetical protein SAMN04487847_2018 [Microbacterium sp. cf332]|nr:hypothetical protein SAMN04487847_2018 [Microbacterium sp. cf332]